MTDGPDRVSQAALFGGTTTILDFALVDGDNTVQQAIERRQTEWAGDCHCDYAFHTMVQGKLDWSIPDQLAEAVAAGHPTVKMFTTDITPSRKGRMVPFGSVMEVLTVLAKTGGLAAIHAEDNDLVMHMYEKLTREGRTSFHNMAEVHTTLSEDLAFNRVIRLAANIEGSALYMLHTSAATGVRRRAARRRGADLRRRCTIPDGRPRTISAKRSDLSHPSVAQIAETAVPGAGFNRGAIQTTPPTKSAARCSLQGDKIDDTTGGNAGSSLASLIYTETVESAATT